MSVTRGGFTPVRHLNGHNTFQTQRFEKSTAGQDASLIYVGDPVRVNASGKVVRLLATDTSASGAAIGFVGVAARICASEAGRPKIHSLTNGQHPNISLTADADFIDVYTDPGIVYGVKVAGTADQAMTGQTMNITTTARVTAAGISGVQLDSGSSAAAENPFRVIGISDDKLGSQASDSSGRVEAIVNYHIYKNQTTV